MQICRCADNKCADMQICRYAVNKIITYKRFAHLQIFSLAYFFARELGFEPRSKVLETRMLPLHHSRVLLSKLSKKRKFCKLYLKNFSQKLKQTSINFFDFILNNKVPRVITKGTLLNLFCMKFFFQRIKLFLFNDFSNLTCTYCTTTFTYCKLQTFLHSDRLNKLYSKVSIITRHNHFSSFI